MKPIVFGNYLLLERLAIGGMAEVWLGKNQGAAGFEKLVALKRILPNIAEDGEFINMFIDEAKIAGQLAHANVAQIFDLGKASGSYYIAMEYVPGVDLRTLWDRVRSRGGFPLEVACHIVGRMCEGLDYAHRRKDSRGKPLGIIHRDISPQNVLVSFDGDVKIIDFGIAKAANRAVRTQTGILKGKFAYMAPEQARGQMMDHRADVFAIGVVLHELITGERLFRADSDFSLLEKVRKAEVNPPRSIRPDIPTELERVVMRALAARPEDRYPWASNMQADLERFLVSTRRNCVREDLADFVREHFGDSHKAELARQQEAQRVVGPTPEELEAARSKPGENKPKEGTTLFDTGEVDRLTADVPDDTNALLEDEGEDSAEPTAIHEPSNIAKPGEVEQLGDGSSGVWGAGAPPPSPEQFDELGDTRGERRSDPRAKSPSLRAAPPETNAPDDASESITDPRMANADFVAAIAGETLVGDGGTDPSREAKSARPDPVRRPTKRSPRVEVSSDDVLVPPPRPRTPMRSERADDARGPALDALGAEPSAVEPRRRNGEPSSELSEAARGFVGTTSTERSLSSGQAMPTDPSLTSAEPQPSASRRASLPVGRVRGEVSLHSSPTSPGKRVDQPARSGRFIAMGVAIGFVLGTAVTMLLHHTPVLGKGTLVVKTGYDEAKVTIEGHPTRIGRTMIAALPVGTHKVTIEMDGFLKDIQQSEVSAGTVTEVRFAERPVRGRLRIETNPPGATVYVDGNARPGVTPMTLDDLEPEVTHELRLQHPEAELDTSKVQTRAGETFKVDKALRMKLSRLVVTPAPDDAAVQWDGAFKGTGKTVVKNVRFNEKSALKVYRPGCDTQELDVTPKGEAEIEKPVSLTCREMDAAITLERPAGGRLRIDGMETGLVVPFEGYKLPSGRHAFELTSGKRSSTWSQMLEAGGNALNPGG